MRKKNTKSFVVSSIWWRVIYVKRTTQMIQGRQKPFDINKKFKKKTNQLAVKYTHSQTEMSKKQSGEIGRVRSHYRTARNRCWQIGWLMMTNVKTEMLAENVHIIQFFHYFGIFNDVHFRENEMIYLIIRKFWSPTYICAMF